MLILEGQDAKPIQSYTQVEKDWAELPPVKSALPEDAQYDADEGVDFQKQDGEMYDSRYDNSTREYLNYEYENRIDLNSTHDLDKDINNTLISKSSRPGETVEKDKKKLQNNVRPMNSSIEILPYFSSYSRGGHGFAALDPSGAQPVQFGHTNNILISPRNVLPNNYGTSYSTYGRTNRRGQGGHAGHGNTDRHRHGQYPGQGVYARHGNTDGYKHRHQEQGIHNGHGNTNGFGQHTRSNRVPGQGVQAGYKNTYRHEQEQHTGSLPVPGKGHAKGRHGHDHGYHGGLTRYGHNNAGRMTDMNTAPVPGYGATQNTYYPQKAEQRLESNSAGGPLVFGQAS